jgi:dynein heavy chain
VQKIVAELNASLQKLIDEYNSAMAEKDAALKEAERCKTRLDLAQRLVSALGSENDRWANAIVNINLEQKLVTGDVLIASAFISYTGPFNKKNRKHMIHGLFEKYFIDNKIPMTPEVNPVKILSDEAQIASWNKDGLPSDAVSIENGTILTNSERYPLIIDPQLQGNVWIKEKEKENKLICVRLGSKNINRDIELAIELGKSVMIENMDEAVDAVLMPVISRQFIQRGKYKIMKFGGKDLNLHGNFRMFLHTKLNNPHYPPEVQAETTLINFTVTEDGLGDQLLTLVVGKERPDLAKQKIELIQEQNEFKIKLKELEKDLLFKLANAKGDILDDIELIVNLENSKKISTEVAIKMEIAKKTEKNINESSEFYRPAALRGALFYFLLTDICRVHSFYKFSLESYIVVINRAIDKITEQRAPKAKEEKTEGQEEPAEGGEQQQEENPEQQEGEKE